MTDRTILIIKTSWSHIITQPVSPGIMFYEQLFAVAPCLIPMFKSDLESQQTKFTDMLTFMVLNLQNMANIQKQIDDLGKRHVGYNVEPEHYKVVGSVLMTTLEASLGDMWDEETKIAWADLYELWSSSMISAGYSPQNEPK